MGNYGSGSGRGAVVRDITGMRMDEAARTLDGAYRWAQLGRVDPGVRLQLLALPSAVAVAAVDSGLRPVFLRQMATAHGARPGAMLGDCVRQLGVARVAGMCGKVPDELLAAAGVDAPMAIAAGVMAAPSCGCDAAPAAGGGCGCGGGALGAIDDTGPIPGVNTDLPDAPAGTGIRAPSGMPADGFPASPPFRPGNFNSTFTEYTIASGDTLAGLARTWVGDPNGWKDIWALNKDRYASPSAIPVGKTIALTPLATAGVKALVANKVTPKAPASPGAPGAVPGAPDPGDPSKPGVPSPWRTVGYVAAGVGATALVGGIGYAVLK